LEEAAAEKAAQNKRLELEAALEEAAEKAAQNKILKLEYALKKAVTGKAVTEKVKVIVLGTIGIGKSTMMNVLCGKDEIFKTSDAAEGCT